MPQEIPTELALQAVEFALKEIGRGEQGRNNDGPDVRKYTGGKSGNWCAAFLAWCFEQAGEAVNVKPPKRSHGAKRFTANVAKAGKDVKVSEENPRKGDVISWHRGRVISWAGHVGIVFGHIASSDTLLTVEGNSGPFPSVVKIKVYPNGAWRKKLHRVARVR